MLLTTAPFLHPQDRLFLRLWSNATFSTKLPQFKQLELIQPLPFPSLQLISGAISLSLSTSSSQSHRKPELEPERPRQRERQSGSFSLNSRWPPPKTSSINTQSKKRHSLLGGLGFRENPQNLAAIGMFTLTLPSREEMKSFPSHDDLAG